MNILVCVKQVPDTTQIKIDPVKHTLIQGSQHKDHCSYHGTAAGGGSSEGVRSDRS